MFAFLSAAASVLLRSLRPTDFAVRSMGDKMRIRLPSMDARFENPARPCGEVLWSTSQVVGAWRAPAEKSWSLGVYTPDPRHTARI
jgi:hypothetical protein